MICCVNAVKRMFYDAIIFFCSLSFQELLFFLFHMSGQCKKLPVKLIGCSPKMLVVHGGWVGSLRIQASQGSCYIKGYGYILGSDAMRYE